MSVDQAVAEAPSEVSTGSVLGQVVHVPSDHPAIPAGWIAGSRGSAATTMPGGGGSDLAWLTVDGESSVEFVETTSGVAGSRPGLRHRLAWWATVLSRIGAVAGVLAAAVVLLAAANLQSLQEDSGEASFPVMAVVPSEVVAPAAEAEPAGGSAPVRPAAADNAPTGRVDPDWAARTAAATGIPRRSLLAYASANLTIAAEQPGCGLGWNTLAAIGAIESAHGSHGGSVLGEDGWPRPSIVGPRLDGNGVAAIRDTDDGAWDGDPAWDRAVGPMQFIPSTWARWGADGNADSDANPNQLDDAALAAARYLCAAGPMTTGAGWRAAVYSYNHSDAYVDKVAGVANEYTARARR